MSQNEEKSGNRKRVLSETSPEPHPGEPDLKKKRKGATETKDSTDNKGWISADDNDNDNGNDHNHNDNNNDNNNDSDDDNNDNNNDNDNTNDNKSTETQLREQIEFYFSDANLPLDDHMLSYLKTNDGWYDISDLLKFGKINTITKSIDLVTEVIKRSTQLRLDTSQIKVQRNEKVLGKLPTKEELMTRMIFAKGFSPRMQRDQLETFWKRILGKDNVLMVKHLRSQVVADNSNNNDNNNKKNKKNNNAKNATKMQGLFLGDCYVLVKTQELMKQICGKTFDCNGRQILTGPAIVYENIKQLEVKTQILDFEDDKCLYIQNVPPHATWLDVKNWILHTNLKKQEEKRKNIRVEHVLKPLNDCYAYVRVGAKNSAIETERILNSTVFMGIQPRARALPEESCKEIWKQLAVKRVDAPVEIVMLDNSRKFAAIETEETK